MVNFGLGNSGGFVVDADETGDTLGSTDGDPGIVSEHHLDDDITREGFFLSFNFGTTADDHFGLDRNDSLENLIFQPHGFDPGFEGLDDFIFVAGVGIDDVPGSVDGWGNRRELEQEVFFVSFTGVVWHFYFLTGLLIIWVVGPPAGGGVIKWSGAMVITGATAWVGIVETFLFEPIRLIPCVNIKSKPPKIREIMMEIDITTKVNSIKVSFLGQEMFLNSAATS